MEIDTKRTAMCQYSDVVVGLISCYDMCGERSTGLPKGREPYGDGASIVVSGRESRPHGHRGEKEAQRRSEAGFPWKGRKGTRDAHSRNDPEHYPRPR